MKFCIHLSSFDFKDRELIHSIQSIIHKQAIDPSFIELNITEELFLFDVDFIRRLLLKIKAIGVRLAISNFGSKYSSYNFLTDFPLDEINLNPDLLLDIDTNNKNKAVIQSIIHLAQELGLDVGIDSQGNAKQLFFLSESNLNYMKNYQFFQPIQEKTLDEFYQGKIGLDEIFLS